VDFRPRGVPDLNVLALNCGSSSVKFRLLTVASGAPATAGRVLAGGAIEQLGREAHAKLEQEGRAQDVREPIPDHADAVARVLAWLAERRLRVDAVGHRVVHGGPRFTAPALLDATVVEAIEGLESLAPLHNGPSLAGIRACRSALPAIPMVAVFDTAFHASLPDPAAHYAIAWELARRHGIRRFGFHGISYAWAVLRTAALLDRPADGLRLVVLHLGSGASAAAIRHGVSVDTSMGLTPLEGLVMRTRSGDVDPALVGYLVRTAGVSVAEIETCLNERSGLAGLAGGSGDVRDLLAREHDDPRARLALQVFCHRARKYLGAYLAVLEGADAVVFTGGIGTYQPEIRRRIAAGFAWCGLVLDLDRNAATQGDGVISAATASMRAVVVEADEERIIAHQTAACLARPVPARADDP
jgi:acetate kinase